MATPGISHPVEDIFNFTLGVLGAQFGTGGGCGGVGGSQSFLPHHLFYFSKNAVMCLSLLTQSPNHLVWEALLQGSPRSPGKHQIFPREALPAASGAGYPEKQKVRSRLSLVSQQLLLPDLRVDGCPGGGSRQPRQQGPDRAELRAAAPARAEGGSWGKLALKIPSG